MLFGSGLSGGKPVPALRSARVLGVPWGDLDAVVISRSHARHVGGLRAMRRRTSSLAAEPMERCGVPARVPTQMRPRARMGWLPGRNPDTIPVTGVRTEAGSRREPACQHQGSDRREGLGRSGLELHPRVIPDRPTPSRRALTPARPPVTRRGYDASRADADQEPAGPDVRGVRGTPDDDLRPRSHRGLPACDRLGGAPRRHRSGRRGRKRHPERVRGAGRCGAGLRGGADVGRRPGAGARRRERGSGRSSR